MTWRQVFDEMVEATGTAGGIVMVFALLAAIGVIVLPVGLVPQTGPAWLVPAALSALLVLAVGLLWRMARRAAGYHRSTEQFAAAATRLQAEYTQLVDAADALPNTLTVYDVNERLVFWNAATGQLARSLGESPFGQRLEAVVDAVAAGIHALDPSVDPGQWKADELRRFRAREPTTDRVSPDGRFIRLSRVVISDGSVVQIRSEITDLKQSEAAAHAAQKRFDMLINSLPDMVYSADRGGRINYVGGGKTVLGYSYDEIVADPSPNIYHPDDWPRVKECFDWVVRNRGKTGIVTFRAIGKDGSIRYLEQRLSAPERKDNLDGQLAFTGTMRDVQEQHDMAERLRYELQRLNSVIQSTGAHIMVVDRDLRIIMVNNGFMSLKPGRPVEDFVGRLMYDVIETPVDPSIFAAWFHADPSDTVAGMAYENVFVDPSGRECTHHVTANPVRDETGRVEHIVFVAVDETDRRSTELQLFAASRLATLGEMASGVAHQINQPLTIIQLSLENLAEQIRDTSPQAKLSDLRGMIDDKLSRIVNQTERAAMIINDLKGFARRSDEASTLIDVSQAVGAAADLLREQLRILDVQLALDFAMHCPRVMGNSGRLQQVILNLILNARDAIQTRGSMGDAMSRGGIVQLRTRYEASSRKVLAIVEDDGIGIPDAILSRLFEPFFTTKPANRGSGLGLSVSYQIMRQMGGTIAGENRTEGGARFTIALDAVRAGGAASTPASVWALAP